MKTNRFKYQALNVLVRDMGMFQGLRHKRLRQCGHTSAYTRQAHDMAYTSGNTEVDRNDLWDNFLDKVFDKRISDALCQWHGKYCRIDVRKADRCCTSGNSLL